MRKENVTRIFAIVIALVVCLSLISPRLAEALEDMSYLTNIYQINISNDSSLWTAFWYDNRLPIHCTVENGGYIITESTQTLLYSDDDSIFAIIEGNRILLIEDGFWQHLKKFRSRKRCQ